VGEKKSRRNFSKRGRERKAKWAKTWLSQKTTHLRRRRKEIPRKGKGRGEEKTPIKNEEE